ncbi:MAG: glycosyltransferase family 4 protein [Rickettsiales bacterium]|nr:glycosyltransferase family 4 protein [Rickettsiales bacterium]
MSKDQKKPTVMQILPALESGGVERGTIDIAKALKKADFEPIVMSCGGILVYQLKEAKINHIALPVNSKNPLIIFRNIKKIRKIIIENNVDIVHVRSRAPMWSAYYACKKTNAKLVSTVHGTYSLKFAFSQNFVLKRLYNSIMLRADKIIVVSDFIKSYLAENYHDKIPEFTSKITVIQRGVDLKNFNKAKVSKNRIIDLITKWNLPEDKKIIMLPARFTAWKGHEFLIDALTKVKSDFCCILVGSDHGHENFRIRIEEKIVKSGLSGKVKIVGVCKDMAAAYAVSHVVLSTSVRPEAFGRIAIESQAMEGITIATKIGGSLETVVDGKTGFLIDVDNIDQLAETIDRALNLSEEEAKKIGESARKNIEENFSNEKMCDETLKVYRSLVMSIEL